LKDETKKNRLVPRYSSSAGSVTKRGEKPGAYEPPRTGRLLRWRLATYLEEEGKRLDVEPEPKPLLGGKREEN